MMNTRHNKTIQINYKEYNNINQLTEVEQHLVSEANRALGTSYSPYSQFRVGAAVLLANGKIILGSNQENVVSPLCLCAERVAINTAKVAYSNVDVEMVAISANTGLYEITEPISPCGACRQSILEIQNRQKGKKIKIILYSKTKICVFDSVEDLLPFSFHEFKLQK